MISLDFKWFLYHNPIGGVKEESYLNNYELKINENLKLESDFLRPFRIEDSHDIYSYTSDDQVTKYLTWDTHTSLTQTERVVKDFYMNRNGIYAIELKSENKCIGCIDLSICNEHNKASFGYVLNKEYWNRGYMILLMMIE